VELAVEGLLLGEALGGVGADRGADVAEDRRRLAARGLGPSGDQLLGLDHVLGVSSS